MQIDKLQHSSSVVSISETEKIILHKNIIEGINNDNPEKWSNTFAEIIKQWDQSIDLSLNKIKNIINSRKSIDTTDIFNHKKAAESKIVEIKEKINEIKSQQLSKSQTLLKLREKYGINTTNAEEIISYIKK